MEKLLTVADICELTAISQRTIRGCLKDGRLVGHKIGGQWRFTQDDLKSFINGDKASQSLSLDAIRKLKDLLEQFSDAENESSTEVELKLELKPTPHLNSDEREKLLSDFSKICDETGLVHSYNDHQFTLSGPLQVMSPILEMLSEYKDSVK